MNAVIETTNNVFAYKTTPEDEIKAMSQVNEAIKDLDNGARERVLNWAASLYMPSLKLNAHAEEKFSAENENQSGTTKQYKDLHEFLDKVATTTKLEAALAVSYWYQVILGQDDFNSQQINDQLKDMGNPIKNITDAFDSLVSQNLVRQTEKSGSSKQARKKFRLTQLGKQKIEQMISN